MVVKDRTVFDHRVEELRDVVVQGRQGGKVNLIEGKSQTVKTQMRDTYTMVTKGLSTMITYLKRRFK